MEIREVTLADARLLFEWANDSDTRANSFHSEPISWEHHLAWLEKKLNSKSCSFFLLTIEEEPVGVVRIEGFEPSIIGVTVAPNHRGEGLSSKIIRSACSTFRKKTDSSILAYIKLDNIPSLKAFEKAGFEFFKTDLYDGEECNILIFR